MTEKTCDRIVFERTKPARPCDLRSRQSRSLRPPHSRSSVSASSLKGRAEDQIDGLLRVRCGLNDQVVVFLQLGNPVLEVSGGVAVGVFVGDTGNCGKEGGAHFGDQFFLAVKLVTESLRQSYDEGGFRVPVLWTNS